MGYEHLPPFNRKVSVAGEQQNHLDKRYRSHRRLSVSPSPSRYDISAKPPAMKRTLNTTINRSKSEKNDEHYTQLADTQKEINA